MGKISLFPSGGTNCVLVSKELQDFSDKSEPLSSSDLEITDRDIFVLNFEANENELSVYDGASFGLDYTDLAYFMILRKDTRDGVWRYMGQCSENCKYYQDFTAGSSREYEYRIIPVLNNSGKLQVQSMMSVSIKLPVSNYATIIGLKPTSDENVYEIDYENIWILLGAVEFDDKNYVMGKTFTDTLSRFPKETVSIKRYIKSGISGMVGDFLCNPYTYSEDYDVTKAWEDFCCSSNLKLVKDLRGNVIPCDIDSFSTSTEILGDQVATSTRFTFTQLKDFDDLTILSDEMMTLIQKNPVIVDKYGKAISSDDDKLIIADGW